MSLLRKKQNLTEPCKSWHRLCHDARHGDTCPEASKTNMGYVRVRFKDSREQRPWLAAFKGLASEELKGKAAAASVSSDSQRPSISKMWQLSVLMALDKASSRCPGQSRFKLPQHAANTCASLARDPSAPD